MGDSVYEYPNVKFVIHRYAGRWFGALDYDGTRVYAAVGTLDAVFEQLGRYYDGMWFL